MQKTLLCSKVPQGLRLFGRGCASSGLSWQAAPANKGANAGTACKDRVDKAEPCPNSRGWFAAGG
ncbi:MAG: hypothetical protein LBD59_07310 [Prevotellaceae bacterium]|nr:hypothetical protein [Prevotellaceae bacterium]